MDNQIPERTKRKAFTVSIMKKKTKTIFFNKRPYTTAYKTANAKLTIQSARIL